VKVTDKSRRASKSRTIARHRVRDSIEQMIVNGRFRPGEKLVQLQLSRQFGVSLGMVREALFELEGLGLVESFDNRGVQVRSIDARSIHELQVLREVFDGVAARECCGKMKDRDARELRELAERIYVLSMAGEYDEKNLLDRQFHLRIAELSDNRLLKGLARQHRVLGKIWGQTINASRTLKEHLAIIDAIVAADPEQAEKAARQHLRHAAIEMPNTTA
jgi:DNA-binding GntR family transcriptional regulator